jgi:hypothetical protein
MLILNPNNNHWKILKDKIEKESNPKNKQDLVEKKST